MSDILLITDDNNINTYAAYRSMDTDEYFNKKKVDIINNLLKLYKKEELIGNDNIIQSLNNNFLDDCIKNIFVYLDELKEKKIHLKNTILSQISSFYLKNYNSTFLMKLIIYFESVILLISLDMDITYYLLNSNNNNTSNNNNNSNYHSNNNINEYYSYNTYNNYFYKLLEKTSFGSLSRYSYIKKIITEYVVPFAKYNIFINDMLFSKMLLNMLEPFPTNIDIDYEIFLKNSMITSLLREGIQFNESTGKITTGGKITVIVKNSNPVTLEQSQKTNSTQKTLKSSEKKISDINSEIKEYCMKIISKIKEGKLESEFLSYLEIIDKKEKAEEEFNNYISSNNFTIKYFKAAKHTKKTTGGNSKLKKI